MRPVKPGAVAGGWWESCDLNGGGELAVQGVSCRRWRCWPSSLESFIYGGIQGVEAVEAGGSGAGGWWRELARILSAALASLVLASGGGESWPALQGILHLRRG